MTRRGAALAWVVAWVLTPARARAEEAPVVCVPERFEKRDELRCPPPRGDDGSVETGYDPERGAFVRTRDGRWELNPYGMVQLRNVTERSAGDVTRTAFLLRAAKLIAHGHVYDPSLTYHFQLNAGDGRVVAEDVYLRWDPLAWLGLFVGQIEVPFNRQHITLEAYQELVDRSAVDARFALQRDLGVALYLSDAAHTFEWTSGVWNGSRQNVPNDDTTYQATTRLAWNPLDPIPFREADLEGVRHARVSVAAAGAYNPRRIVTDDQGHTTTTTEIAQEVVEATLRFRGLSLSTEGHARRRLDATGRLRVDYGTFVQMGQFAVPHRLELVVRLGNVAGDLAAGEPTYEETIGASFYLHGHRLKLQADASNLGAVGAPDTQRVRAQVELFF